MRDGLPVVLPREIADLVAGLLEGFATDVEQLPGVSRTNPHVWGEEKSDLVHKMRCRAKELRTVPSAPKQPLPALRPGSVQIGRRTVAVELRGRRHA